MAQLDESRLEQATRSGVGGLPIQSSTGDDRYEKLLTLVSRPGADVSTQPEANQPPVTSSESMPVAQSKGTGQHDISIVGLGILKVDQITIEAERAIRRSNEVLYVETGIGIRTFLMERCNKVTDLTSSYIKGHNRLEAYHVMAASVIESALDHSPVTFALYGHPTIFAYPPFLIYEMACKLNLSVNILPGISAMDCIFAELLIDPATNGMQMYEATDLLLRKRPLQADASALIWQVGAIETALHSNNPSRPERLKRFKAHLLNFYPAQHEICAVYCSSYPLMASTVYRFALEEIDRYADKMHSGFTLYVPPAYIRPVQDQQLARDVLDPTHLERITRT
jgi:uncharacterized protein YabN with tetrapyrrole methylase and pyrophosphatase domain